MNNQNQDYKNIPGWGMDIDPDNEPTYPIKNYTGDDHNRSNYEKSAQQPITVELLKSTERPQPSVVFGTSAPPSGLSGAIRRYAFKHSEDRYRHWIPLILADRVNAWEGIIDDFKKGTIPNIIKERGWKSELRHNPVGMIGKAALALTVGTLVIKHFCKRK
ncbi:hypothetical protein ASE74_13180 [Pedobacter sp. Leaf216]|uniref:hypothetical protein n=1 Tax=Pedobacter sp. Leaf216 TaxID=1735684 RepID=UPI0007019473|nr:hypothetical protein [Pedobacter sp. Leaf216]KQM78677.1 hypothetical protein ASE74_13180 [Pedobacter sp. Leaf216]